MKYSYYPGCTLHSTGAEYGASTRAVFEALGIELAELPDWSCCGASSGHSLDHELGVLLAGRNLVIAQRAGLDLVVPCAACYSRLRHAQKALSASQELQRQLGAALGEPWSGGVVVLSALAVIADRVDGDEIAGRVKMQLKGLRAAPYYGCLLTRPRSLTAASNPDHPVWLDRVVSLLGADVADWSYKTDCCGAGLSLTRADQVGRLVGNLVDRAVEAGANCIVTTCPMCQANLEMRQPAGRSMPVFYFTELIGLAFGLPDAERWWGKHLVDPRPLLRKVRETVSLPKGAGGS